MVWYGYGENSGAAKRITYVLSSVAPISLYILTLRPEVSQQASSRHVRIMCSFAIPNETRVSDNARTNKNDIQRSATSEPTPPVANRYHAMLCDTFHAAGRISYLGAPWFCWH
ncbi:unnamed protein product, partial [Ectocarpus sp. 12 AP-2014]